MWEKSSRSPLICASRQEIYAKFNTPEMIKNSFKNFDLFFMAQELENVFRVVKRTHGYASSAFCSRRKRATRFVEHDTRVKTYWIRRNFNDHHATQEFSSFVCQVLFLWYVITHCLTMLRYAQDLSAILFWSLGYLSSFRCVMILLFTLFLKACRVIFCRHWIFIFAIHSQFPAASKWLNFY